MSKDASSGDVHSTKKKQNWQYTIAGTILIIGFLTWVGDLVSSSEDKKNVTPSISQQSNVEYLEITEYDQGYNLDYVGHRCDWTFVKKGTYIVTDIDGIEHRYDKSNHSWDIPLDLSTGKYKVKMESGSGEIKKEIIF